MIRSDSTGKILSYAENTRNTLGSASSATELMGKTYSVFLMNLFLAEKKPSVLKQNFFLGKELLVLVELFS